EYSRRGIGQHGHHPDVDQLCRLLPDGVHAQQLHVLAPEQEFEKAVFGADDPAARVGVVGPTPDDVVYTLLLEGFFVLADHPDLWYGGNARRQEAKPVAGSRFAESMPDSEASLLHARGSQSRETDHVSGGVYVRRLGPEVFIDGDESVFVRGD